MDQIAALRAEWLARLAEAIEGAQRVAWQLRTCESASKDARELYTQLESARIEIESLRGLSHGGSGESDGEWLRNLGWNGSSTDSSG